MKLIDTLVHSYMDQAAAVGAAIAILKDGEISYLGGFGTTSVEEGGVEVTPNTLFAYGSIAKNICAALIMRLVEQDLLALDVPIVHYLPDLHFSNIAYGMRITLRHLLSHTSGLPMAGKNWGPCDPDSLRRFVYQQIPLYTFLSEPGTVHLYSNTVFCIAGHVAEVVTGKYYDDLVQEFVFAPLQMDHVTFDPLVAMTYPVALPHESDPDGKLHVYHSMTYNVSGNPSSFALGSVSDLANLAQMYLNGGRFAGRQFLTAASISEMQRIVGSCYIEAARRPLADNYLGYGLGFQIGEYRGRRAVGHGGMALSYNCFFKLFPDDRAGVVVLTNYSDEPVVWKMVTSLYDHALSLPHPESVFPVQWDTHAIEDEAMDLQCYIGLYLRVETAEQVTIAIDGNTLVLERQGKAMPLAPVGNHQFFVQVSERYRLPVAFVQGLAGQMAHVMIGGEPYHPFPIDRFVQPDLALWRSYEGIYKDPSNRNREEMVMVRLQDGVLYIAEGRYETPCQAISNCSFLCELGMFEFEDTHTDEIRLLVRGKATRYYPLDKDVYLASGVIRYLVDVPVP
jgi:CubicO group peptidase (beta-lactamase class C family)